MARSQFKKTPTADDLTLLKGLGLTPLPTPLATAYLAQYIRSGNETDVANSPAKRAQFFQETWKTWVGQRVRAKDGRSGRVVYIRPRSPWQTREMREEFWKSRCRFPATARPAGSPRPFPFEAQVLWDGTKIAVTIGLMRIELESTSSGPST